MKNRPNDHKPRMKDKLEELFSTVSVNTQVELRNFIKDANRLILGLEKEQIMSEEVDGDEVEKWKKKLRGLIEEKRELPEKDENEEGYEALRILQRQISLADTNQQALDGGTLKLINLGSTCEEIEVSMKEAGKKMYNWKRKERKENRNLMMAFGLFLAVCLYILVDRLRMRFL